MFWLSLVLKLLATALFIASTWAALTHHGEMFWPLWILGNLLLLAGFALSPKSKNVRE